VTAENIHTQLVAKVNEQLELAKAAHQRDLKPGWWNNGSGVVGLRREVNAFLATNDPATVIRHCERDLRVLSRHVDTGGEPYSDPGYCRGCHADFQEEWAETWPCDEIRDLAYAHGVSLNDEEAHEMSDAERAAEIAARDYADAHRDDIAEWSEPAPVTPNRKLNSMFSVRLSYEQAKTIRAAVGDGSISTFLRESAMAFALLTLAARPRPATYEAGLQGERQ